METIELTQGKVALVDDADYDWLSEYKWHVSKCGRELWYAARRAKKKKLSMHRLILSAPFGLQVDHIDGDGLNNQRSNLRLADRYLNHRNYHRRKATRLGLPVGVKMTTDGDYCARINVSGHRIWLGTFDSPLDASAAYAHAKRQSVFAAAEAIPANH